MQTTDTETLRAFPAGLRNRLFSAMSWRMESRVAGISVEEAQRARERFGRLLYWAGAHGGLPSLTDRAAVLCFHGVGAGRLDPEVHESLLPVRGFRQILRVLKRSFRVISLAELVETLEAGRNPPAKSVVITFDDGCRSAVDVAAPELDALKLPWSVFLPAMLIETGRWQWVDDARVICQASGRSELSFHVGSENVRLDLRTAETRLKAVQTIHQRCRYLPEAERAPILEEIYGLFSEDELQSLRSRFPVFAPMTWEQARHLRASGVEVGNHSTNHLALAVQTPQRIRYEVLASEELFKQHIGPPSPHFSYPYGSRASYSEETAAVLRQAGYRCALTLIHEMVRCPLDDLMSIPRLIVAPRVGRTLTTLWQRFNG